MVTPIQRTIEYSVTNGLGYHERRNSTRYAKFETDQDKLNAHLLNLNMEMIWDLMPRKIVVDTTQWRRTGLGYLSPDLETPFPIEPRKSCFDYSEPIFSIGSGLRITHPPREQGKALIDKARRMLLEGGKSERPAKLKSFLDEQEL